jgi:hypothetical protein
MSCSFNSVDGMRKVEAESSAKAISLEDLLAGDVFWRCECVGQTSWRFFFFFGPRVVGGGRPGREVNHEDDVQYTPYKGGRRVSRAWMFGLRG